VRIDHVAEVAGQALELPLEPLVLEGDDLAAVAADEMVMVVAARVNGLVASDPGAEVDPLHEPKRDEEVERAVDTRNPDATITETQTVEDLLRGEAAILPGEKLDDRDARTAPAMARPPELADGVLGPPRVCARGHPRMITGR
jgi:hypothetical protein